MTDRVPVLGGRRWIAVSAAAAVLIVASAEELRAAEDFSQKQKVLITAVIFGGAGGVAAVLNHRKGSAKAAKAGVAISPRNLDFGRVAATGPAMNFVAVSNPSAEILRISELRIEPPQFEAVDAPVLPLEIQPGTDWKLRVQYRPQSGKKAHGSLEVRGLLVRSGKSLRAKTALRGEGQ